MSQNTDGLDFSPEENKELEERIKKELSCIEEIIADRPYTVQDVLKNPLKSALREIFRDLQYGKLLPGKTPLRKAALADLATLTAFGFLSVPHELMHAGMNILTGRGNKEIVINKIFGGDLYHWFFPSIESKLMLPIIGGYVMPESTDMHPTRIAVSLVPYIMTPVGIYLLSEGKKKKNIPYAIVGSGLVAGHLGGIIGDFLNTGHTLVHTATAFVAQHTGFSPQEYQNNDFLQLGMLLGGFYVGVKVMSFTYRLSKAGVNYLSNKCEPTPQTAT